MKKTYINPLMKVVKINIRQQMLSGSPAAALDPSKSVDANDLEGHSDDFDW